MDLKKDPPVSDICLIAEGTYPFITGGVSSWIHMLITSLPEKTFSILHITSSHAENPVYKYDLPDNIVSMVTVSLHDSILHENKTPGKRNEKKAYADIYNFHKEIANKDFSGFNKIFKHLVSSEERSTNTNRIFKSKDTWAAILKMYKEKNLDCSFIDYFWTWRFVHLPVFQMLNAELPPAKIYHTVSTGYAGLVGVLAKFKYQAPLLLTEHGIYAKERDIEIRRAEWIHNELPQQVLPQRGIGVFKEIWTKLFLAFSQLVYEYADKIITISNLNQQLQLEHGADPSKCMIIPNAINTSRFKREARIDAPDGKIMIGFVGRVVPIKDVKTLIKACKLVSMRFEEAEFLIMGPLDEDEEYAVECKELTGMLQLESKVKFLGRVNVKDYYPKLSVSVLTSISEGQPLTILEGMAVGVPTVSSDVGACKELLYGRTEEDKALGKSGLITNIGSPGETADAICEIISDREMHSRMVESGFLRVEKYYRDELLIKSYRDLYNHFSELADKT